jgi:hypothetical protein
VADRGLGELLDAQWEVRAEPQFLSEHDDELRAIERGYGEAKCPENDLEGFSAFGRDPGNDLPALPTVLTKPWELTARICASYSWRWISGATAKPPWLRPGGKPPTRRWPPQRAAWAA